MSQLVSTWLDAEAEVEEQDPGVFCNSPDLLLLEEFFPQVNQNELNSLLMGEW